MILNFSDRSCMLDTVGLKLTLNSRFRCLSTCERTSPHITLRPINNVTKTIPCLYVYLDVALRCISKIYIDITGDYGYFLQLCY